MLTLFNLQFHLERANAEEFHEVYKGVVNEYKVSDSLWLIHESSNICLFELKYSDKIINMFCFLIFQEDLRSADFFDPDLFLGFVSEYG